MEAWRVITNCLIPETKDEIAWSEYKLFATEGLAKEYRDQQPEKDPLGRPVSSFIVKEIIHTEL